MRDPAAEKLEIIRLVEGSHLTVRQTLAGLGIPPATFYRWYERFQTGEPEALADRPSRPDRVWSRIPDGVCGRIVDLALAEPELSPRELAVRFTEVEGYFVSETSVCRLLVAPDRDRIDDARQDGEAGRVREEAQAIRVKWPWSALTGPRTPRSPVTAAWWSAWVVRSTW
jgi:hypothetical protein